MSITPADRKVLETKNYVICFFDVLGTTNKLKRDKESVYADLWGICSTINQVKGDVDLRIKTFSDNFLLAIECNEESKYDCANTLANIVGRVYANCLTLFGCPLRGIITYGSLHMDENFAIGEGLVRAYQQEQTKVIFPRIVFDEQEFKFDQALKIKDFKLFYKDVDERYVLNPLACSSDQEIKTLIPLLVRNIVLLENTEEYKNDTNVYIKIKYLHEYIFDFLGAKKLMEFTRKSDYGNR